jgi:flagellar motility protein MotE (MotC chaperone)
VRIGPARTLAAAGTAGIGVVAAVAAYLKVGGLPGVLYAAGIVLATLFGAAAIYRGGEEPSSDPFGVHDPAPVPQKKIWGRKARLIAELQVELAATASELEEHRQACANLAVQLSQESEAARQNDERLQQQIRKLEAERDGLHELVVQERERFEHTLDELGGGLGRHGNELAELERELEALITR